MTKQWKVGPKKMSQAKIEWLARTVESERRRVKYEAYLKLYTELIPEGSRKISEEFARKVLFNSETSYD